MSETDVTTETQVDNMDDLDAFSTDFFGQKPVEPVETKTEAEPKGDAQAEQDAVDDKSGDTDAQKPEADPNADPDAEFKEAPPKKKTVQDRIDELVKQREDIKREGDARLEKLRQEFEEKFAALAPKAAATKTAEPTPLDLTPEGAEKYPLGEFDPQYIRDLTRFTLEQERAQATVRAEEESRAREATKAQEALTSDWNSRLEAAKADYPDLVEKATPMLNGFGNLDPSYAGYLSTVLMSMEKGPDVLYYLSNHPEEATSIVNSGAQKATLALGRIEARFLDADAQKLVAKPKVSKAPPPAPVQARGTNGAFISVAPDTDDLDAFTKEFFVKRR